MESLHKSPQKEGTSHRSGYAHRQAQDSQFRGGGRGRFEREEDFPEGEEGFFDCVAARPAQRAEERCGHSAQNDNGFGERGDVRRCGCNEQERVEKKPQGPADSFFDVRSRAGRRAPWATRSPTHPQTTKGLPAKCEERFAGKAKRDSSTSWHDIPRRDLGNKDVPLRSE